MMTKTFRFEYQSIMNVLISLCLMMIFLPYNINADNDDVAKYSVKRATAPITIDGKLDETEWQKAEEAPLRDAATGLAVPFKTTVRLLWDDKYLYVAFYGEDNDVWATYTKDDENLWEEEVFEMFIDPEKKGHTYYEININPANAIVDLFILNGGEKRKGKYVNTKNWNFTGLKHGVFIEGEGYKEGNSDKYWTAELAIPFEDFWTANYTPPRIGDMWRMNFFRIERGKSNVKDDDWQAAFSFPKGLGFHIPWRFGKIYFVK
jgi:hypothetical protein